jgi:metacaspase-1
MAKGISIHVGVNQPAAFPESELKHCEDDANAMFQLGTDAGFSPASRLLSKDATFDNVVNAIHAAADELKEGDTFLFTFAGHGTQDVILNTTQEPDGRDETMVLADHLLFDNFWRSDLWPRFKPGVRAIAIADCCNSGGVFRILHFLTQTLREIETQPPNLAIRVEAASRLLVRTSRTLNLRKSSDESQMFFPQRFEYPDLGHLVMRTIPQEARQRELDDFKAFYAKQLVPPSEPITLDRLLLSACEEGEDALEGEKHGAFTQALIDVWNGGKFVGNYRDFMTQIRSEFSGTIQHPDMKPDPLPNFSSEHPFTI